MSFTYDDVALVDLTVTQDAQDDFKVHIPLPILSKC